MYRNLPRRSLTRCTAMCSAAFGKDELIDGIPYQDWMDSIGTAAPVYLNDYSRMQLRTPRSP